MAYARDRLNTLIAKLSDAARRDPLTQLLNRRGFTEVFDVELERARRTDQGLSVVVGDLDGFKQINDRFGHAAGDEALQRVGRAILRGKRSWDSAARVGGEEFAVLAPDTDEHGAYIVAERLRTAVEHEFVGLRRRAAHGELRDRELPRPRADRRRAAAGRRPGALRRQAAGAQPVGDLQRGGARDPRPGRRALVARRHTWSWPRLLTLAEALDVRDSGSATHCRRVGRYAELIARELGLPPDAVERVRLAGILHDVGRVGMPDELVVKDGPLSEREWELVRSHPEIGARMLDTTDYTEMGQWILRPPRAPRRQRLPRRAQGRRGAARGRDPGGRGRLRGDDGRAPLPRPARSPGGRRRDAPRGGPAVRRARGGRAPASGLSADRVSPGAALASPATKWSRRPSLI